MCTSEIVFSFFSGRNVESQKKEACGAARMPQSANTIIQQLPRRELPAVPVVIVVVANHQTRVRIQLDTPGLETEMFEIEHLVDRIGQHIE